MDEWIIHSDLNGFYASAELLYRPDLRNKPVIVGGSQEARHGICLAGNRLAKRYGLKVGTALVECRRLCPGLVILPPNYPLYLKISHLVREIYYEYTDTIEPFGLDEAWARITDLASNSRQATMIADEIRNKVKEEIGLTVSIGVSWNKPYAKLGSDIKKPDWTTTIDKYNYKDIVYPLPASDLLYVGPATAKKLSDRMVRTIGDIAAAEPKNISRIMHSKVGNMIWTMATGNDLTPVAVGEEQDIIKSIGNSSTFPRDLIGPDDVKMGFWMLAESVAARLRSHGFLAKTCVIQLRGSDLVSCERQLKFNRPSCLASEFVDYAIRLYMRENICSKPLRSLGIRGTGLVPADSVVQLSLFDDETKRDNLIKLEHTMDYLRERYGYFSLQRGTLLRDRKIVIDAKNENIIHPVSYIYSS